MNLPLLWLSLSLAAVIAAGAYLLHSLSLSGGIAAFFVVATSLYLGSFGCFTVLVSSFLIIAVVGKLTKKRSAPITAGMHEKDGARDAVQVLANGLPAVLCAFLFFLTEEQGFAFAYFVAIGEALSDSLASDVGVLSKAAPRDILTLQRVARGTSGGVSLLGTLAAFTGAVFAATVSVFFYGFSPVSMLLIVLLTMAGVFLDSLLGARLQCRRQCQICGKPTEKTVHCGKETAAVGGIRLLNNDAVNLISNLTATALAAALFILI